MTDFDPVYYTDPNAKPPKQVRRTSAGRLLTVAIVTLLTMCVLSNIVGRVLKDIRTPSPAQEQRLERVEAAMLQCQEDVRQAYFSTSSGEEYAEASRKVLDESIARVERVATGQTVVDYVARAVAKFLRENRPQIEAHLDLLTQAERTGAFEPALASSQSELREHIQTLADLIALTEARLESLKGYSSFIRAELETAGFRKREIDRVAASARSGMYSSGALRVQELDIEILTNTRECAELLLRSWGAWELDEVDGLLFERDEDVDRFNELVGLIQDAAAEQESIMRGD